MSSISSLRKTTFPGVAARFLPSSKELASTWLGRPLLLTRSSRKLRVPDSTLPPPVSNARFSAAGLVSRKFVGEDASSRKPSAISAFASLTGSPCPATSTSSAKFRTAR
jgi:hypothetical protein